MKYTLGWVQPFWVGIEIQQLVFLQTGPFKKGASDLCNLPRQFFCQSWRVASMSDSVERKNTRRRCADSLRHSGTNLMSKWNMRKMSSCQRFTQENYPASFFANNESYWVVLVLKTSLFLRSQGFRNHPLTSIIIVVILWNWSVRFWWPSWIGCSHRYLKASVVCFIIMWSLYRLNSFTVKRRTE